MPVDVATIPNVELVRVGVHEISSGVWDVTRADLADAVAAARAGIVRDPVIKLGHEGRMGDGAPALGRVRNLRTTNGGDALVGDFVDVPRAVAAFLPKAWPARSVEGFTEYEAADGRTYGFVMTAVALLGSVMPGVHDLADIPDVASLYGVAARSGRPIWPPGRHRLRARIRRHRLPPRPRRGRGACPSHPIRSNRQRLRRTTHVDHDPQPVGV